MSVPRGERLRTTRTGTPYPAVPGEVPESGVKQTQTTQFSGNLRCEAYVRHDRQCWIRERDSSCIVCDSTGTDCIFTRVIERKARRDGFTWEELTSRTHGVECEAEEL